MGIRSKEAREKGTMWNGGDVLGADIWRYIVRGVHLLVEVGGVTEPGVESGRIAAGQARNAASHQARVSDPRGRIVWDRAKTGLSNMLLQHLLLAVRVEFHAQGGLVSEFWCLLKQSRHQ